jgi:hypothetical protein
MLIDRQRANCLRIAQGLDAGNLAVWRRASLSPAEEALVWHLVREPVAHGQRLQRAGRKIAPYSSIRVDVKAGHRDPVRQAAPFSGVLPDHRDPPKRPETELQSHDLDYWADEIEPDDDDEPGEDTVPCPVCDGRGKDAAGNVCDVCNGSGRVPAGDDDNDEEEEEGAKGFYGYIQDEE